MNTRLRWSVGLGTAVLLIGLVGCGSGVNEALYQTASAAGRTALDIFLTELANALADTFDQTATPPDDDGNGGDADDGDGNGGDEDVPFDDLVGDPVAGEPLYASCAACHCADAGGDCLPGAPGVVGASAEALDEFLRGDASHPPSDLSNQEIVDLEAYLGSL